jgi:hypothetical protein
MFLVHQAKRRFLFFDCNEKFGICKLSPPFILDSPTGVEIPGKYTPERCIEAHSSRLYKGTSKRIINGLSANRPPKSPGASKIKRDKSKICKDRQGGSKETDFLVWYNNNVAEVEIDRKLLIAGWRTVTE